MKKTLNFWTRIGICCLTFLMMLAVTACESSSTKRTKKDSDSSEEEDVIELIYENMENTGHCKNNWLYRIADDPDSVNPDVVQTLEDFPEAVAILWSEGDKDLTDDRYDEFEIIVIQYETAADVRSKAVKSEFYHRAVIEKGYRIAEFVGNCVVFSDDSDWLEIALDGID